MILLVALAIRYIDPLIVLTISFHDLLLYDKWLMNFKAVTHGYQYHDYKRIPESFFVSKHNNNVIKRYI